MTDNDPTKPAVPPMTKARMLLLSHDGDELIRFDQPTNLEGTRPVTSADRVDAACLHPRLGGEDRSVDHARPPLLLHEQVPVLNVQPRRVVELFDDFSPALVVTPDDLNCHVSLLSVHGRPGAGTRRHPTTNPRHNPPASTTSANTGSSR